MKSNTTLTATMLGRQFGKSMFGKNVTAVWADEAEELFDKPVEYLDIDNPLAVVCAMIRKGKQGYEVYNDLSGDLFGSTVDLQTVKQEVEQQDVDRADKILNYFVKKHTMRRLKGEFVSKFMLAVDEIGEDRTRINKDDLKVLVSLPRIYEQNLALERVMKDRKSAKKMDLIPFAAWHGEVEFIERVLVRASGNTEYHYHFSTPNNYVMRIVVKDGYALPAWDAFAANKTLYISTEAMYTYPIRGYDFNVLQPSPKHMEIKML